MVTRGRPTRTTRSRPVTTTPPPVTTTPPPVTDPTTTTSVTSAQLQAMIDEGVTAVLAARAANTGNGVIAILRNVENQVKFATCTLMGTALTWWNSHARTVTNDVAYAMTWSDLKKKMTTKYCPRNEIKKIETELWNLKKTEEVRRDTLEITKPTSRTKGRIQAGLMLPGTVTGNRMKGLNLDVPSVTSTTVPCTPKCTNCRKLATWPRTVEPACHSWSNAPVETKNQGNGSGVDKGLCSGVAGQKPRPNNVVTGTVSPNQTVVLPFYLDTGSR
ncbi:reverse transcriptase domain-containing protein [Tanacetum coccineum]